MYRILLLLLLQLEGSVNSANGSKLLNNFVYKPHGTTFNVTDFTSWIISSVEDGATILTVSAGEYMVLSPPLQSGAAHVNLVEPLSNIELIMTGVTLLMESRMHTALYVTNWINVTFRGLTIAYVELPTNQAIVLLISDDRMSIDVEVPDGYPIDDWVNAANVVLNMSEHRLHKSMSCNAYLPGTRYLRVGGQDMYAVTLQSLGKRQFRMGYSHPIEPGALLPGDTLGCRNSKFAFTTHFDGCSSSTFSDLTVLGGPGFGFFHSAPCAANGSVDIRNLGGNKFERLKLTYPVRPVNATIDPVLSASADGFHIASVPSGPIIRDTLLEGHNDDGIAIHGKYSLLLDANLSSAPTIIITSASYSNGDVLKVYDQSFKFLGFVKVLSIQSCENYVPSHNKSKTMPNTPLGPSPTQHYQQLSIEGDKSVLVQLTFDCVVFNANRSGSHFSLTNNTIRNHRARGMLIKASHGWIEGNHIANSSIGGIIITPELNWGEGDFVTNLTVVNNVIENVCIGAQCSGGIALGALNPEHQYCSGPPFGHNNILIESNIIRNISQMNLWVSSTYNAVISNNSFEIPFAYKPVATCCPPFPFPEGEVVAWFTSAYSITGKNNCVAGASKNVALVQSTPTLRQSDDFQTFQCVSCTPPPGSLIEKDRRNFHILDILSNISSDAKCTAASVLRWLSVSFPCAMCK